MAFKILGSGSPFQVVCGGRSDDKMPEEPVGRFPESRSSTFLSFWPKLCPVATLDTRVIRNVAFGSKLCLIRLKWTCVHQEEAKVATGEVIPATCPGGWSR